MDLRLVHRPVLQTDPCNSLPFPPAPGAVTAPQTPQLADPPPGRDSLDGADRARSSKSTRYGSTVAPSFEFYVVAERRGERRAKRVRSTAKLSRAEDFKQLEAVLDQHASRSERQADEARD